MLYKTVGETVKLLNPTDIGNTIVHSAVKVSPVKSHIVWVNEEMHKIDWPSKFRRLVYDGVTEDFSYFVNYSETNPNGTFTAYTLSCHAREVIHPYGESLYWNGEDYPITTLKGVGHPKDTYMWKNTGEIFEGYQLYLCDEDISFSCGGKRPTTDDHEMSLKDFLSSRPVGLGYEKQLIHEMSAVAWLIKIGIKPPYLPVAVISLEEVIGNKGEKISVNDLPLDRYDKEGQFLYSYTPSIAIKNLADVVRIPEMREEDFESYVCQNQNKYGWKSVEQYGLWGAEQLGWQIALMHNYGATHGNIDGINLTRDFRLQDFADAKLPHLTQSLSINPLKEIEDNTKRVAMDIIDSAYSCFNFSSSLYGINSGSNPILKTKSATFALSMIRKFMEVYTDKRQGIEQEVITYIREQGYDFLLRRLITNNNIPLRFIY